MLNLSVLILTETYLEENWYDSPSDKKWLVSVNLAFGYFGAFYQWGISSWLENMMFALLFEIITIKYMPLEKNPPAMWDTWVWSLSLEDPLEKGKDTHSSIVA